MIIWAKGFQEPNLLLKCQTKPRLSRNENVITGNVTLYGATRVKFILMVKLVNVFVFEILVLKQLLKALVIMVVNI